MKIVQVAGSLTVQLVYRFLGQFPAKSNRLTKSERLNRALEAFRQHGQDSQVKNGVHEHWEQEVACHDKHGPKDESNERGLHSAKRSLIKMAGAKDQRGNHE